eukprot:CAMPEP_0198349456 /NCGR_PEP_ID=MMETSP1450-20131203/94165_1 /TAXON_ID=753684 ORGANISM="Madagascaria erythrocladiodes, Strain CCMP3234" /NCGR_SAMPLE_ID=MMETSP1450 /ASSEMBLY_ACC=CAM_ASM_001115 /LENGTH=60 /DNA_ID=CAMNT_0044055135 /DNA_START=40 /DNA_END=219 /DNA_ORIENTATION=+
MWAVSLTVAALAATAATSSRASLIDDILNRFDGNRVARTTTAPTATAAAGGTTAAPASLA